MNCGPDDEKCCKADVDYYHGTMNTTILELLVLLSTRVDGEQFIIVFIRIADTR